MLYRYSVSVAMLFCVATSEIALAAEGCWLPDEAKAARMHNLQTYLMINALKCRDTIPATFESYNGFTTRRQQQMLASKYAVHAHFVRLHGPVDGAAASTSYDTQQGNRLSADTISVKQCETAGLYARLATGASDDDLLTLAAMLAGNTELVECPAPPPPPPPARPAAMVIPVWEKKAPAAIVPTAVAATTPVPAVATSPAPAPIDAGPARTATPVPPATVASSTLPPAKDERQAAMKALEDATAALKQAAAALQANPAAPAEPRK